MTNESTGRDYESTPKGKLKAGEWLSFTESTTAWGTVWPRGSSVQLNADLIQRTIDRHGDSWLDTVDDEGARIQRGQWPAGVPAWRYGDPDWEEARESARRRAWAHLDPVERASAREAVERLYGPPRKTSQTLNNAPHPSEFQALQQDLQRSKDGVRVQSHYSPTRRED